MQNLQGNTCVEVSFSIKLQPGGQASPQHGCFPVNFEKFSRTRFCQNITNGYFRGNILWKSLHYPSKAFVIRRFRFHIFVFLRKNFGFIAVAWINLFTRNYWYDHIWASWIKLAFSDINSMRNYTLLSLQATLLYATTGWNWQKTKQMLSNTLRLFQNYSHSSFTLSFKNNTTYSKK